MYFYKLEYTHLPSCSAYWENAGATILYTLLYSGSKNHNLCPIITSNAFLQWKYLGLLGEMVDYSNGGRKYPWFHTDINYLVNK